MDSDELRKACELAGMLYNGDPDNEYVYGDLNRDGYWWSMDPENPALPAYIASLLVAKMRHHAWSLSPVERRALREPAWWWDMTDEQRIRAAVVVLEEGNE